MEKSATTSLSKALQSLLRARRSAKAFDPSRTVSEDQLGELKTLALRAPSSFNAQPFKCVLVRDQGLKDDLAHAMVGINNARRVRDAPLTAVFLADTESWTRAEGSDNPEGETFQQRKRKQADVAFVAGAQGAALRKAVQTASLLAPTKIPEDPVLWSVKQTIFFVDHWLLSCAALGLSTAPMEGYNEPRVRDVVGASSRYYCPVVVPTGYTALGDASLDETTPLSPRYNAADMFFDNQL